MESLLIRDNNAWHNERTSYNTSMSNSTEKERFIKSIRETMKKHIYMKPELVREEYVKNALEDNTVEIYRDGICMLSKDEMRERTIKNLEKESGVKISISRQ